MRFLIILSFVGASFLFLFQCENYSEYTKTAKSDYTAADNSDGYVGESSCMSCHQKEYDLWKGSHHDWAMKPATKETVLGDFNNHQITLDGVEYIFKVENKKFVVRIREIDGTIESYKIDYTFGVTPLQQYIVTFEKGKRQVLRASWDTEANEWFHQYAGRKLNTNDWLHWTKGAQTWNTMCADCHSTNLKRNYSWEKDSFNTTWSSINVSCEGCHGPGKKHVDWAENDKEGHEYHILVGRDQQLQINQCAPCHSRRVRLTENMTVGMDFEEQFLIQSLTSDIYHPDGQVEDENYVMGSFLQSKMYHNGVKCNDCHNSHSMELKMIGNSLCIQCHDKTYDTPKHHFHQVNTKSAECVSCHMTGKTYMGNDFRRDHSFRVPRPDQSVLFGTPNACTGCHTDKDDEWAAANVEKWYGDKRPEHFSNTLLVTNADYVTEEQQRNILSFIADPQTPSIARATAIENYSFGYSEEDYQSLIGATQDKSALVRHKSLMKFMDASPEHRHTVGLNFINDPAKIVRIAAAQLLVDADPGQLQPQDQQLFIKARKEYEEMLFSNSDFPLGRLNLGDYYFRRNDLGKAIEQYKMAIQMDSLLAPVYSNLATVLNISGRNKEALHALNTLLTIEPNYARGYYLRALLHYELHDHEAAIQDFNKAIKLDPNDFRSFYNLATLLYERKEFNDAEKIIIKGLQLSPDSHEAKHLLTLIKKAKEKE